MKLYINKFPVLSVVSIIEDNIVDKRNTEIQFEEGKIFRVIGVSYQDVILECEGITIYMHCKLFAMAFTETDVGHI